GPDKTLPMREELCQVIDNPDGRVIKFLRQANLTQAVLQAVNLRNSVLIDANFTQAQLIQTDLFRARGANLTNASIDPGTTMPNGFPYDLQS
ncbi:MAG: pentapeptide repeat-containing protein, partial [Cyanobacteria bacterium P01_A01_bin.17]